jgi:hypothetical protein
MHIEKHAVHVFRVMGGWKEVIVVAMEKEKKVMVRVDIRQKDGVFDEDSSIFFGMQEVRKFDVNDSVKAIAVAKRIMRRVVKEMVAQMCVEHMDKDE